MKIKTKVDLNFDAVVIPAGTVMQVVEQDKDDPYFVVAHPDGHDSVEFVIPYDEEHVEVIDDQAVNI